MSLRAPIAVVVEIRGADRRAFRLAHNLGEDGVGLVRPAPFEIGRPVDISLGLPGADALPLAARAEVAASEGDREEDGGRELRFVSQPRSTQEPIRRYVAERLGLPLPG